MVWKMEKKIYRHLFLCIKNGVLAGNINTNKFLREIHQKFRSLGGHRLNNNFELIWN